MTPKLRLPLAVAALLGAFAPSVLAQGYESWSCRDLWAERNQIYKDAGYCFRTARAINYFGNAGCVYDRQSDVPLSATQRRIVAAITRAERRLGCAD